MQASNKGLPFLVQFTFCSNEINSTLNATSCVNSSKLDDNGLEEFSCLLLNYLNISAEQLFMSNGNNCKGFTLENTTESNESVD